MKIRETLCGRGRGRAVLPGAGDLRCHAGFVVSAFPKELIAALAGLALFAAIAGALAGAMAVPSDREAALVTFLTTASGMSLFGLSAVFWGSDFRSWSRTCC